MNLRGIKKYALERIQGIVTRKTKQGNHLITGLSCIDNVIKRSVGGGFAMRFAVVQTTTRVV